MLVAGIDGVGLFFVALTAIRGYPTLIAAFVAGGVVASAYVLAVNALGGDLERRYRARAMVFFHAGFSGAAAAGAAVALNVGGGFRIVYAGVGTLLVGLAVAATVLPLPSTSMTEDETGRVDVRPRPHDGPLWRVQGVGLATSLVRVCFFGDGALEGFTSLHLRGLLGSGALLGGLGIAAFHLVGLGGRLLGGAAARRWGERRLVTGSGATAAVGMARAVATTDPRLAVAGLLLVGFGLSPTVPTAFSLAGRAAPGRGARAVSLVTTVGSSAFAVGPFVVGGLANVVSLRVALLLVVVAYAAVAMLARGIPEGEAPRNADAGEAGVRPY